ncbi:MAG: hypothetical protein JWP18_796 [Solirubrobacterales bacterium]|nr:hypothetical protein [Solirubrobacterales bacterium]
MIAVIAGIVLAAWLGFSAVLSAYGNRLTQLRYERRRAGEAHDRKFYGVDD